ncbi:MAG: transcriptional repressor [Alistipes sp.]|nr:transcriptional repressor [Alistipes sp.]
MDKKVHDYLSGYDIRPSLQRIAVMEYLMTHKTHPTADEIYIALAPAIPTLSRTTIYNTLSTLLSCGAIQSLDLDSGRMHYDGDTSPHAHFICTRCGAIHDIFPASGHWEQALAAVPPPEGTAVSGAQLSYKGLCAKCNKTDN